ncbi:MAG: PAS domain-containing protein [Steroidobacteraceae bacterium]
MAPINHWTAFGGYMAEQIDLMRLLLGARIGVWQLDVPSGRVERNVVWSELLACQEPADAVGAAWMARVHPEDLPTLLRLRDQLLRGEIDDYWHEYRVRRGAGDWIYVRAHVQALQRDAGRHPLRLGGIIFEISREKEQEKRFHAVFDRPFQYIGLLSADGRIIESNRVSLEASGCRLEELVGKEFWASPLYEATPESGAIVRDCVERAMAGEMNVRTEIANLHRDGTMHHVDFTVTPIKDQDGRITHLIPEARDITDVVRMRAELLRATERLQTATAGAQIGLWDFNPRTEELWLSPESCAMMYLPEARAPRTAQEFSALFHPEDVVRARGVMDDLLAGLNTELRHELRIRDKGGNWRWMMHRGRIIERDEAGRPMRVVGVQMDVNERHEMEAQLAAAQRLEALGQLAAGVSHEINTPVQYVNDSVYFVRDAMLDLMRCLVLLQEGRSLSADDRENLVFLGENLPLALNRALDGLGRVSEIVRSMKEFAHPDRHEMAPVDLNQAVQSTLVVARNEYKHVARLELELGVLPLVKCHGGEINQVLLNLIVNAAHAVGSVVENTGRMGVIRVTTHAERGEAIITVADSGCGIPASIQHRVFEPFFTTKGVGRGTGQGLAIAHQLIVRRHGGRICFTSELGKGTTFTVGIPIAGHSSPAGTVAA